MRPSLLIILLLCAPGVQAQTKVTDIVPTPAAPFVISSKADLPDLEKSIEDYMSRPPKAVRAHPAAKDFPGEVTASERVTKSVEFSYNALYRWNVDAPNAPDLATSPDVWQETGLYAAPGEVVTVTVGDIPSSRTLEIIVGCHHDRVFGRPRWTRFPLISRKFKLSPGVNKVANAFGGQIFIKVEESDQKPARPQLRAAVAKASLTFADAVAMPSYVEGKDTPETWKQSLASSPAPWGTIVSKRIILHVPRSDMEKIVDPKPLIRWWDKVIELEDDLVALRRHAPERMVPDREIGGGYMHSGYPFMCNLGSGHDMVDLAKMEKEGNWGFFHELGHNHQNKKWTFHEGGNQAEVTCNLFSLYCMDKLIERPVFEHRSKHGSIDERLARRMAAPPGLGYSEQLAPFEALMRAHGWEPMRTTLRSYAEPLDDSVKGEPALKNLFVQRYGAAAKSDVAPFFAKLGYPITKETRAKLSKYPVFEVPAAK